MNKREVASLASKVLGMFFIIQGTNVLSNIFVYSATTPNAIAHEYFLNSVFSLVYIISGFLLWFFSGKLSIKMTDGENHSNKDSDLTSVDLQGYYFRF